MDDEFIEIYKKYQKAKYADIAKLGRWVLEENSQD
jgi:hypothetical protein